MIPGALVHPVSLLLAAGGGGEKLASHASATSPGEQVLFVVVDVGIVAVIAAIVVCIVRLLRGPTLVDRGLAGDTIAVQVAALAILLTIRLRTLVEFDVVLIVSILGFISTIAFAQFVGRRRSVA